MCFGKDPKIVNYDSLSLYLTENTDDPYAKYSGFIKDYLGVREILLSDLEVHERETPVFFWIEKNGELYVFYKVNTMHEEIWVGLGL